MTDDVGEEGLAIQAVLADLERGGWLLAVLGVRHHHLVAFKVLKGQKTVRHEARSGEKGLPTETTARGIVFLQ